MGLMVPAGALAAPPAVAYEPQLDFRRVGASTNGVGWYAGSRYLALAAPHGLAQLESFEPRVIQIQRLVVFCPIMRGPKRLRFGPRFKGGTVFPGGVRS